MALPTTGISVTLVRTTIGGLSNDVGTLCLSGTINKWSRKKPVRRNILFDMSDNDWQYGRNDDDTLRDSYGLKVPVSIESDLSNAVNNDSYTYVKPVGGAGSPFRLGDFRSYEHLSSAPCDVAAYHFEISIYGSTSESVFTLPYFSIKGASQFLAHELNFNNILVQTGKSIADCYLAFVFKDGNRLYHRTTSETIGDLSADGEPAVIKIKKTDLPASMTSGVMNKEYYLFAALHRYSVDYDDAEPVNTFKSLPYNVMSMCKSTFSLLNVSPISLAITKVCRRITSLSSYSDAEDISDYQSGGSYFDFHSDEYAYFGIEILNSGQSAVQFDPFKLWVKLVRGYPTGGGDVEYNTKWYQPGALYYATSASASLTRVTSDITVNPNQTIYAFIDTNNAIGRYYTPEGESSEIMMPTGLHFDYSEVDIRISTSSSSPEQGTTYIKDFLCNS